MPKELIDCMVFEPIDIIQESSENGNTAVKVQGLFQVADRVNANKRVYPNTLWDKLVSDKEIQERVKGRSMMGELDHPPGGVTRLSNVSHIVTDLRKAGKEIIGTAEILTETPQGKTLVALLKSGVKVGVSSRGNGTTYHRDGLEYVNEDYKLRTFDFVADPSTFGAYPKIVSEDVEPEDTNGGNERMDMEKKLKQLNERLNELRVLNYSELSNGKLNSLDDETFSLDIELSKLIKENEEYTDIVKPMKEDIKNVRGLLNTVLSTRRDNPIKDWGEKDLQEAIKKQLEKMVTPPSEPEKDDDEDDEYNNPVKEKMEGGKGDDDSRAYEIDSDDETDGAVVSQMRQDAETLRTAILREKKARELAENGINEVCALSDLVLERYYAALEVIDELAARYTASKEVIKTKEQEIKEIRLKHHINEVLKGNSNATKYRGLLEKCNSTEEIDQLYEQLKGLVRSYPADLPNIPGVNQEKPSASLEEVKIENVIRESANPEVKMMSQMLNRLNLR